MASIASTVWDANLYLKFADARTRPAIDLMNRLDPANGARAGHAIYDLGCGAGNIARLLADRFPRSPVIGIDSSEQMLEKARSQTENKRVTFAKGDLTQFKPDAPPAILYSNAAYQWVPGHIYLFPGLMKLLPSGGQLAPVSGLHNGEEYRRSPTSVIGFGFGPVTVGVGPYGRCSVKPAGISLAATVNALSA